jgi:M6 family metalloprotease-like protein
MRTRANSSRCHVDLIVLAFSIALAGLGAVRPAAAQERSIVSQPEGEWEGQLVPIVFDDFQTGKSTTVYRMRIGQEMVDVDLGGRAPDETAGGTRIKARGVRAGNRLVASGFSVQDAQQAASACSAVGEQKVAVLLVTFPDSAPPPATPEQIRAMFFDAGPMSLDSYWREVSYGQAWATGDVFGWFALDRSYAFAGNDAMFQAAIQSADAQVDLRKYNRIFLVFPPLDGTPLYKGWGSLGCYAQTSPRYGEFLASATWLPLTFLVQSQQDAVQLIAHEGGHNLGLGHAILREWDQREPIGPLNQPGSFDHPYTDFSTVMGGTLGHYDAPEKARLGWLHEGSTLATVEASGSYFLSPMSAASGDLRALKVRRGSGNDAWLWIEFRQPLGAYDSTLESPWFHGATIHYEDANTAWDDYLIDFTTGSLGGNGDAPLPAGASWTDPYTNLSIRVGTATSAGLMVGTVFEPFCATLSPGSHDHSAEAETGSFQIIAPPACAWTVTTSANWIAITSATTGSGNATVTYSLLPDGIAQAHTGIISVGGAKFTVNRTPAENVAPSLISVVPVNGSGAARTFTLTVEDANGADDIASVRLTIGETNTPDGNCAIDYLDILRRVALITDGGSYENTLGSSTPLGNSVCSVDLAASSATKSGSRLTLNLAISFEAGYSGAKRIFVGATDTGGLTAGPQDMGGWTVTPPPGACYFKLREDGAVYHAPGGSFATEVRDPYATRCAWTAVSNAPWITVTSGAAGRGSGTVRYTVAQNTSAAPRSGSITIAGKPFTVAQAANTVAPYWISTVVDPAPDSTSIAADGAGNLYYSAGNNNCQVLKLAPGASPVVVAGTGDAGFAGDGGPATAAQIGFVRGLATDRSGNLYIADDTNRIRRVSAEGTITTIAGTGIAGFGGDGGPAVVAQMNRPVHLAADSVGGVYVDDCNNSRIRKISTGGNISTVAGNGTQGATGDGGPAAVAGVGFVNGLAADEAGNLYLSDAGGETIRTISPNGIITRIAGLDGAAYYSGDGGPASQAVFNGPSGVAVDGSGNLFIADMFNNRVRQITPDGLISTVAGTGSAGFSGDGSAAALAQLNNPANIAADGLGNLFILDMVNPRIRKLSRMPLECISSLHSTDGNAIGASGAGNVRVRAIYDDCARPAVRNAPPVRREQPGPVRVTSNE